MQLYIVGGAVRDRLLGEPVHDRDWVAVGATPQQLLSLGYKPVGKDFPVFLHPTTGEEVALARTERKSARGYHGFVFHAAPDVTLEQDLARRDLTINAMAEAPDGTLVDPFGGRRDLESGVLRHVSPAFAEDPVRLLRLARFAARWPHFTVAAGTAALLQQLVRVGEVDALVPERVWQELARGLMAPRPSRMFQVLRDCGALTRLLAEPALDAAALARVDAAAANDASLAVRFALLGWPDGAAVTRACARLRASTEVRELAELVAREGAPLATWRMPAPARAVDVEEVLALFERCDALRRPARFESLLEAAGWLAPAAGPRPTGAADPSAPGGAVVGKAAAGRSGREAREGLRQLLVAATTADTAAAASTAARMGARGPAIGEAVRQARLQAVRAAWPPA